MTKRNMPVLQKLAAVLLSMLGVVLLLGAAGIFSVRLLLRSVRQVGTEMTHPVAQQQPETPGETVPEPEDVQQPTADAPAAANSEIRNFLLVGQDRLEGESRARSDAMILFTFNRDKETLTMTSFLRDLYVEIPGYKKNRLNAAYAMGGMALLEKTLAHNFGLSLDGMIEVDFDSFVGIIDLAGGVEIDLREDEAEYLSRETGGALSEGLQLLDGQKALAYARIRKLDSEGDFGRTRRQRNVLTSLLGAYRNAKLSTLLKLAKQVLPLVATDMTADEILTYALELAPMMRDAQIISRRIPEDGAYTERTIDGMAVLVADLEAARLSLADSLN